MLPKDVVDSAGKLGEEFAWRLKDLPRALQAMEDAELGIVGGEVWIVRRKSECKTDEPISKRDNRDPNKTTIGLVLADFDEWVVYGPVATREGVPLSVFTWKVEPRQDEEDWKSYVARSIAATMDWINAARVEDQVLPHLSDHVFYNVGFKPDDNGEPRRDT